MPRSEKKKDWEGGRKGEVEGLECWCDTESERETDRAKGEERSPCSVHVCVFVSPPNQFSWGIYHRLQRRRQVEGGKKRRPAIIFSLHKQVRTSFK